jgi:polyhydroxybutyrate depolymerase
MKITRRKLLIGAGCLVFVASLYAAAKLTKKYLATLPRADADGYLQVGHFNRAYNLHVPSSYTGQKPVPLVLAFHPVGGDGKEMEKITGFNSIADQEGFIVVYPDAIAKHWDSRRSSAPDMTNDVGFISALIEELSQRYQIDSQRIYVTGFSNGATFAHRLGCELSNQISAIAAVASAMPANLARTCNPTKPLSVLLINGTKDEAFPYTGTGKGLLSLSDTIKFWTDHNRCSTPGSKRTSASSPHVRVDTYGSCANQTSVILYTIEGGGHSWGDDSISDSGQGVKPGQELNESTLIWKFFSQQANQPKQSKQSVGITR